MKLPFTVDAFYEVFARYNLAVWPLQIFLLMLGLACVAALSFFPDLARHIPKILAALWAWTGLAYHFAFFTAINPAAWAFGVMCLVASAIFLWQGARGTLVFRWIAGWRGGLGAALIGYALVVYPILAPLSGRQFPATPTFGAPCPTTIFTLGVLVFALRPVPRVVFVIPLLWAGIGSVATFSLGVVQDVGLLVAAALLLPTLAKNRPSEGERARDARSISHLH